MAGISPSTYSGPYTANGSQTAFPFDFTAGSSSEIAVDVDGTTVSSALYTVAVDADYNGGTVTFLTAPANAAIVTLYPDPDFLQSSEFENEGAYKLSTVNTINRRAAIRDLWLRTRALLFSPAGFVHAVNRVGKFMGWDADGNPAFLSGTGADSALRTDLATSGGSALAGFLQSGTGAIARSVQAVLRDTVSVNDFGAVGDGTTNDTVAINKAILAVALNGGGEVTFGASASGYKVTGTLLVVTGVDINLNGQRLLGAGPTTGTMFATATLEAGVLTPNAGTPPLTKIVRFVSIHNGYISNVGLVFDFVSFEYGCSIENIATVDCNRVIHAAQCFYMKMQNVSARGFSDVSHPTYGFYGDNNAIVLIGVSGVTEFTFHFEGGTTACSMLVCTSEGGTTGLKLKGNCAGLAITGCYFENVATAIDLTEAADCHLDFNGNYFHIVDVVLDDGASTNSSRPLFGRFSKANFISPPAAAPARALMRVSGAFNLIDFELPDENSASTAAPANWVTSATTRLSFVSGSTNSATDIRARNIVTAGILPRNRSGDVGTPVAGTVPFCTITYPTGATVTLLIDTKIAWQPDAAFTKFCFKVTDDNGSFKVRGDTYGDQITQTAVNLTGSSPTTTVAISNSGGFVRYSIAGLVNASGIRTVTGGVELV